ncbi:type IV secretion system DNA-binding domain-containing protein [Streptomyces sp. CT34]|uniref:type IV secretion system DNA-binding domain-containing protein n=1 Tax=Streptomyces sp. CT34 TaxID=1553907 RepID=UPI0012FF56D7|nr:type IV secretion system DNA-binding domain-containing protein [Streptomyces sp. CT34]
MSSILTGGQQGPERRDIANSSDQSSAVGAFEQGHILLGGTTGSGKSGAVRAILAAMQPGTTVRVVDLKGEWAADCGTQKAGA